MKTAERKVSNPPNNPMGRHRLLAKKLTRSVAVAPVAEDYSAAR